MGALNVHLLLWVDDGVADRSGKVVATVPRSSDEKALQARVLKYQVHNCREGCVKITPSLSGRTRELCGSCSQPGMVISTSSV